MADKISTLISQELNLPLNQVANTVSLLRDDNSIPFISRYRKEATGGLDEQAIQSIEQTLKYYEELQKRKSTIIKTIEEQGKLTDELTTRIMNCYDANTLEDIYLPYKPKRRTRAQVAREQGLEPLAKIIMAQHGDDIEARAARFITDDVPNAEAAIKGAQDIIAEWVSENEAVRNSIRRSFRQEAMLISHFVKGKEIEGRNYENYYEFKQPLRRVSSHQLLAIRRGESEGFLKVSIDINDERAIDNVCRIVVRGNNQASALVEEAAEDSYKRLIRSSIETEFAAQSKAKADEEAIDMFAQNARQLLFAPPLGHKRILAIDPGFRTGCKVVCLDEQGNLLHNDVIYPTPPANDTAGATRKIQNLTEAYKIQAIALGNGTASRETERFLKRIRFRAPIDVYVVSENGASIYSASKIARDEFPDKDVTVRGAVSIGRRLLDPLAELVKIDPKSIGVGQYQHDVDQGKLKDALTFTVESCVNSVGVNINTASKELLTYVSGLGPALAQNIVNYRAENGDFTSRQSIMNVPKLGIKTFTQAAGFLRVPESSNPLDNSAVHPERYALVEQMAKDCGCTVGELINDKEKQKSIDINRYVSNDVGMPTLVDIMKELEKPGRDPRSSVQVMEFDENVHDIKDLRVDMELNGIVTNITQFGAFVDIGIHEDGLVHVSQMSNKRVESPAKFLKINQHVRVRVINVDLERKRIALSMKGVEQPH
ncbi:MAG: RNA-binding transcriptional accessory protein [Muribaculaceae bacterium]|nr:RNA-binding transcriptional accessory protein [Muribaculaceae bacterium]MBQ4008175.1 RNA-binding transcriptional accessory protein [Muribaculaceae bacterium]